MHWFGVGRSFDGHSSMASLAGSLVYMRVWVRVSRLGARAEGREHRSSSAQGCTRARAWPLTAASVLHTAWVVAPSCFCMQLRAHALLWRGQDP